MFHLFLCAKAECERVSVVLWSTDERGLCVCSAKWKGDDASHSLLRQTPVVQPRKVKRGLGCCRCCTHSRTLSEVEGRMFWETQGWNWKRTEEKRLLKLIKPDRKTKRGNCRPSVLWSRMRNSGVCEHREKCWGLLAYCIVFVPRVVPTIFILRFPVRRLDT